MQKIMQWGIRSNSGDIFDDGKRPFASFTDCLAVAAHLECKKVGCEIITLDIDGELKDVEVHFYATLPV